MTDIGNQNISFSLLRARWSESNFLKSDNTNATDPGNGGNNNISLSEFRGALFTNSSNVPTSTSAQISINTHFVNNIFGSGNKSFVTNDFNFDYSFSGESDRLHPLSSLSSNAAQTTGESKISRLIHSNVSHNYPSMLLCPQTDDPTIDTEDNAEVWIKLDLYSTNIYFQIGVIHDHNNTWSDTVTDSHILKNRHGAYSDRIVLHTLGYITHAGHDIESGTKKDEILDIQLTNPTDIYNYHNRYGYTAGSGGKSGSGLWTVNNNYYYLKNNTGFYNLITLNTSGYYIGMKITYYEITLTGDVQYNSNVISNVQISSTNNNLTNTDNVYTGMYLSSSDTLFPADSIIQSITYSTSTSINMGSETDGTTNKKYGYGDPANITFKAFGQRLEFQYTDKTFNKPKNLGPNHIILPRKYKETTSTSILNNINSWAFMIGDTTSLSNSGYFTIQSSNPTNYENINDSFIEISNRVVDSDTYMGSVSDYDGNYDVSETQVYLNGYYNIYIGIKVTAPTYTYYNDISIAAVQVLTSSNVIRQTWIFNSTASGWETYTSETVAQSSIGFPVSPLTASGYSYSTITNTTNVGRFSYTSSTSSSYTGTKDGITTTSSAFTVGNNTVPQSSGSTNYLYRETSGSTRYTGAIMRSPAQYFEPGDKIRVVHMLAGYSQYRMNADDSLYLGAYTDLRNNFHSINVRVIDSDTYMGSIYDYNGHYDVSDTIVGHTGSYRIYLGVKVTAPTFTYYNDISIAAIQIVNYAGTTVKKFWNAAYTSGLEWQTYTSETSAQSTKGFPVSPLTASGYSYSTITGTPGVGKFSYTSSTGSSYTGTRGGIENTTNVIRPGVAQVAQVDNKNYFFRETSGSTRYTGAIMRSPSFNFTAGDRIRIVHLVAGYSQYRMDENDSLYIGLY